MAYLSITHIDIKTDDGRVLAGTQYWDGVEPSTVVLINSATGVPRRYYDAFARRLAALGIGVLTYDYRGVGDSASARGTIEDWGRFDMPAALEALMAWQPDAAPALVCHSVGGQILGLAHNVGSVRAAFLIASQSGYWRCWDGFGKLQMWFLWWVLMPVLSRLTGRFPGRWFGSADLPADVARSWARWGRCAHYVCDQRGRALRPHNDDVRFPIRWLSFADDAIAPLKAVEALRNYYPHALQERFHLSPEDLGMRAIGHFGFFRPTTDVANWDAIGHWLRNTANAPGTPD